MIDRQQARDLWMRWSAGDVLPAADERQLAEALAQDGELAAELVNDARTAGALTGLGRAATEGPAFVSRCREALQPEAQPGRPRWPGAALRWIVAPAAAAALTLAVVAYRDRAARIPPRAPEIAAPGAGAIGPTDTGPAPRSAATQPAIASVESSKGAAFALEDARKVPLAPGRALSTGQGVLTAGPQGEAVIVFAGTRVRARIGPDTLIGQVGDGRAVLARGRLAVQIDHRPLEAGTAFTVSTPHADATARGTRFTLKVSATETRLVVDEGRVDLVRHTDGARALVEAGHEAAAGDQATTGALKVTARQNGLALLIFGGSKLSVFDERVKRRAEALGFEVGLQNFGATGGAAAEAERRRASVILISESVGADDVSATDFRDLPVPLLIWEPELYDDLGLTGPSKKVDFGKEVTPGEAVIKNASHPLAAGLKGTVKLQVSPAVDISFGAPGPFAIWIATNPEDPTKAHVFAYERGTPMPGLAAAPARRVGFFFWMESAQGATDEGWALFDAALRWCAEDGGK